MDRNTHRRIPAEFGTHYVQNHNITFGEIENLAKKHSDYSTGSPQVKNEILQNAAEFLSIKKLIERRRNAENARQIVEPYNKRKKEEDEYQSSLKKDKSKIDRPTFKDRGRALNARRDLRKTEERDNNINQFRSIVTSYKKENTVVLEENLRTKLWHEDTNASNQKVFRTNLVGLNVKEVGKNNNRPLEGSAYSVSYKSVNVDAQPPNLRSNGLATISHLGD